MYTVAIPVKAASIPEIEMGPAQHCSVVRLDVRNECFFGLILNDFSLIILPIPIARRLHILNVGQLVVSEVTYDVMLQSRENFASSLSREEVPSVYTKAGSFQTHRIEVPQETFRLGGEDGF